MAGLSPSDLIAIRMSGVQPSAIRRMLEVSSRPGIVSFAGGLPAADLFDVDGLSAASEEVMRTQAKSALQYGATAGPVGLREQLCAIMKTRGANTDPDQLIVTTGAQQALDLIARVMLDPGDIVFVERPTYATALQTFNLSQATIVGVASDDDGIDTDQLERGIVAARAAGQTPKLIYLIPNFSNPAGWTTGLGRRRALAEIAARHKVTIVEDDPYGDLYFDKTPPPSIFALSNGDHQTADWVVYLASLSKIVAPGLRVGWAVLPRYLVKPFNTAKQANDLQSSTFIHLLAERYLATGALPRHLPKLREGYRVRCDSLCDALARNLGHKEVTFQRPKGGMFVWAKLRPELDAEVVVERAIGQGVVFVPGRFFFANAPEANAIRLTFATATNEQIETGTKRLAEALAAQ